MAFPTSGLSNNQVHKEGNRAFVYDSALGVWDQVRETDKSERGYNITEGEIGQNVSITLGSKTVFPAGHIIQTVYSHTSPGNVGVTDSVHTKFGASHKGQITGVRTNSIVLVNFQFHGYISRSSGTTTESNCGFGIQRLEGTFHATNYDRFIHTARDWQYHLQAGGSGATSAVFGAWVNITGIDTAPNTGQVSQGGATNTYYVTANTTNNGNQQASIYADSSAQFNVIIQELAQ